MSGFSSYVNIFSFNKITIAGVSLAVFCLKKSSAFELPEKKQRA
jgi:hypothetical protein